MAEDKTKKVIQRIDSTLEALKNKQGTLYFFVADTKNTPNAKMAYCYEMAHAFQQNGYNVCMLYQLENEYTKAELDELNKKQFPVDENRVFEGVGEWLGEKYMKLKHMNIAKEEWEVSPADFLFIPEAFSSLMKETYDKNVPCKRYVIMQNFKHISEFIPFGDQWASYGISDAIVQCEDHEDLIKSVFPYTKVKVLPPAIPEYFRKPLKAKKLIVNIVSKNKYDAEHIVKMFYWKYPFFQFVPFRFLVTFPREQYAEMLQEGAITVWVDYDTSFGYNAIESMKCGNIIIGKRPETMPEWMYDFSDEHPMPNGIWVDAINDIPTALAAVVNEWLEDETPEELIKEIDKISDKYTQEEYDKNAKILIKAIFDERIEEVEAIKNNILAQK